MKFIDAKFIGSYPDYALTPDKKLPEIAIGGRSNVGKSSLINSLLRQRKIAQVSKTPGKTRLLNYFLVLGKNSKEILHIVDLPGFGYAEASIELRKGWKKLVEDYIEKSGNLRGFLLLIDSRRGLQDEELQLLEYLALNKRAVGVALTKADKIGKVESAKVIRETVKSLSSLGPNNYYPILHSAKNGVGNELIWRWIFERINDEG